MKGTAAGLLSSLLMLTLLQAIVSSSGATGRIGTLLSGAGTIVEHLASPSVPAIPDLRPGADRNAAPALNVSAPGAPATITPAKAAAPPRLPAVAGPSTAFGIIA